MGDLLINVAGYRSLSKINVAGYRSLNKINVAGYRSLNKISSLVFFKEFDHRISLILCRISIFPEHRL